MKRIKYVTKQTIIDLLKYEEVVGIRFNQMPNDRFMELLPEGMRLNVIHAFRHVRDEGEEMRVMAFNPFDPICPVMIDMPVDVFNNLGEALVDLDEEAA